MKNHLLLKEHKKILFRKRIELFIVLFSLFQNSILNAQQNDHFTSEKKLDKSVYDNILSGISDIQARFMKNMGQWDGNITYSTYTSSSSVCFLKNGVSFCYKKEDYEDEKEAEKIMVYNAYFIGMNEKVSIAGTDKTESKINYVYSTDPSENILNVPQYNAIRYNELYNNIDIRYYKTDVNQLKYDLILKPGADLNQVKIKYDGVRQLKINANGRLEIYTPWGTMQEESPYSYQVINGIKKEIKVSFRLVDRETYSFKVLSPYDQLQELIIDPTILAWSTYACNNGVGNGYLFDMAVDPLGDMYVTGWYGGLYTTPGVIGPTSALAGRGIYIWKLGVNGNVVKWGTYLNSGNEGHGIGVNSTLEPVVVALGGNAMKLNSTGSAYIYNVMLGAGGFSGPIPRSVVVNSAGEAFITGSTTGGGLTTVAGSYDVSFGGGGRDAFVVKLNNTGTRLYATYLGGSGKETGIDIDIDNAGNAYITGATTGNYPMQNAYDNTYNGGVSDIFVSKLNPTGTTLLYSTYVGGNGQESDPDSYEVNNGVSQGIVVNPAGEAFVTSQTSSTDFPAVNAYDPSFNAGTFDCFVFKLNAAGNGLIYSTYIGGNDWEGGCGITVNSCDEAIVIGESRSLNFPITSCAFQTTNMGNIDFVVFKLNTTGNILQYSTFLGGSGYDYRGAKIRIFKDDPIIAGTEHMSGTSYFPTTPGAWMSWPNGYGDLAVMAKFKANGAKADFSYTTTPCNIVTFTDMSNGNCVWQQNWKPSQWIWNFGDGTTSTLPNPSHTYTSPGSYNVQLIVSCPNDTIIKKIVVTSAGSAYAGPDAIICTGNTVQLNASGGTSYTWTPTTGLNNPNISNPIASPAVTTKYVVTVGGATCNVTDTVNVTVVNGVTANAGPDVNFCQGDSVQLNANGGMTYVWSPATGLSDPNIANPKAAPGSTTTYTVTVSSGTCSATDQVVVTRNTKPVANAGPDVTMCMGSPVPLSANGGTSYSWSPQNFLSNYLIANPILTAIFTNTYRVTVFNGACSSTDDVLITVNPAQPGSAGADQLMCRGSSVTLNGSLGTTYSWTPSTGLSNTTISNPVSTAGVTTDYIVKITNGNPYCVKYDTVRVNVDTTTVDAGPNASVCSGVNVQLGAQVLGTPASVFFPCGSNIPCSGADITGTLGTTAPSGTSPYAGTATDYRMQLLYRAADLKTAGITAGKLKSIAFYVTTKNSTLPYSGFTIKMGCTSASTLGFSWITGLTTVFGPVNYSSVAGWNTHMLTTPYNWDGSSNIIVEICWDNSTVSAADVVAGFSSGFGSVAYASNATNAESGCSIAAVGGSTLSHPSTRFTYCKGVPQFSWSPAAGLNNASISNPIAAPATTTTYTVTVTGLSGCTKTDVVTVQVNSCGCVLSAQANVTANVSCNGGNNGSASVSISNGSGPYTYKWSNGSSGITTGTTLTNSGLVQGTYTVSITEGACTSISIVSISQPDPIAVTSSLSAAACNGTAVVTATGGTGVLSYNWSNGATGQTVSGLAPGTSYTITVSDANACSTTALIMINAPANFSTSSTNISCSVSGSASVSVSSGTSPYSFTWTNGATGATVSGLASGNYTVSVTEGNGCVTTKTFSITGTSAASATFSNPSACVGSGVTFTNTGTTGTYSWNIGSPINVSGTTV
ncbi:MAG: PKD domain-containing protein, partial [Bacteroidetes bacterium]|nr:PKD domain-containing protein [Bacteroidota bacterium]